MLNHRFGPNIFWAGFIGFLLGILFTFTIWAGNRILQTRALIGGEVTTASSSPFSLTLTTPTTDLTTASSSITISGVTSQPSTVLISGGAADATVSTDGKFTATYTLLEGDNEVSVSAIDSDGREASVTRDIFYTTDQL